MDCCLWAFTRLLVSTWLQRLAGTFIHPQGRRDAFQNLLLMLRLLLPHKRSRLPVDRSREEKHARVLVMSQYFRYIVSISIIVIIIIIIITKTYKAPLTDFFDTPNFRYWRSILYCSAVG